MPHECIQCTVKRIPLYANILLFSEGVLNVQKTVNARNSVPHKKPHDAFQKESHIQANKQLTAVHTCWLLRGASGGAAQPPPLPRSASPVASGQAP
jgi:hypothetical protein